MKALITGGAKRLGGLMARDLARRGWDLCLHYHTSTREAHELQAELSVLGVKVELVQADLGAPGGAEALADRVQAQRFDLVVHSASSWTTDTWQTATALDWEQNHRLHGWTMVVLSRLLARQGAGLLITLLDARSRDRDPTHFSYGFAKRELLLLTRALALELAPHIRVNGLALGLVLKPDAMAASEWKSLAASSAPLQKPVRPQDVVRALNYLVRTPSLTGQVLSLDSGRHLKGDLFGSI